MTNAEVARIVAYLESAGIRIWLDGGWGVDALVGEETRPHSDLDAAVELGMADQEFLEPAQRVATVNSQVESDEIDPNRA